jgi:hypothetical protein
VNPWEDLLVVVDFGAAFVVLIVPSCADAPIPYSARQSVVDVLAFLLVLVSTALLDAEMINPSSRDESQLDY